MEDLAGAVKLLAVCVFLHGCMGSGSSRIKMDPSVAEHIGKSVAAEINRQIKEK